MAGEPVRPDYGGRWIGAVVPALRGAEPVDWLPEPAVVARRVVLLVLDGLGWNLLRARAARVPNLAAMEGVAITSVAPTTTAAALTSITTGAPPAEHGLVGYRILVDDGVLNVLRWRVEGDGARPQPPDPERAQLLPPFDGEPVPVVTKLEFATTGFTRAHLRGGVFHGWETPSILVEQVRRRIAEGRRFIYAYYDGVDRVAHARGLRDGWLDVELAAVDALVGAVLDVLPGDAALVVTADHGMVEVAPGRVLRLDGLASTTARLAGESRFRSLVARRGAAADLLAAAEEVAGDDAWVLSRERLFDDGWLGPGADADVRRRVGDVVLAARADAAFADPASPLEDLLVGRHGSLTADEVLVPLVAAYGRG